MVKEIMINGVNVAGCEYFDNPTLGYCKIGLLANDGTHICECEPDCYFKQLQRKEQECERLKKIKGDYFFQLEAAHQGVLDKNEIMEKIEEIIVPYQESIELDALSLPTAIESILERLQTENGELRKDNQNFKKWTPIISRLLNKFGSYNHAKGLAYEQYALNLHKELDRCKQALGEIKPIATDLRTRTNYRGADEVNADIDKILIIINEVLKDE